MARIPKKASADTKTNLLTVEQRERWKKEIAGGDALLDPEESRGIAIDESRGAGKSQRLQRMARALEVMDPANRKLTGQARQQATVEMKALEAYFRETMLTQDEMSMFPSRDYARNQAYNRAITKSMKGEVGNPEFQKKAARYKYLARLLEPDDPELPNLERFRKP